MAWAWLSWNLKLSSAAVSASLWAVLNWKCISKNRTQILKRLFISDSLCGAINYDNMDPDWVWYLIIIHMLRGKGLLSETELLIGSISLVQRLSEWKSLSCVRLFVSPLDCSPWNSPGQNTGVGSLTLPQGIFPTQVSGIAGGFFTSWATREAQEYWSG